MVANAVMRDRDLRNGRALIKLRNVSVEENVMSWIDSDVRVLGTHEKILLKDSKSPGTTRNDPLKWSV